MASGSQWDHAVVFEKLIELNLRNTVGVDRDPYVVLYDEQRNDHNCALLYSPQSRFRRMPLHLHPGRKSWRWEVYRRILPAIGSIRLEHKPRSPRTQFLFCDVKDWALFADELLGLIHRDRMGRPK
jgi:hypothetical protein